MLRNSTAPISAGLLRDTEGYFRALMSYREGDAAPIVTAFADAGWFASQSGIELIDLLAELVDEAHENLSGFSFGRQRMEGCSTTHFAPGADSSGFGSTHRAYTSVRRAHVGTISRRWHVGRTHRPAKKARLDPRRNPPSSRPIRGPSDQLV